MVATFAVNTPLRRIRQHTVLQTSLVHTPCNVPVATQRLSRRFGFHKFDPREQTEAAYVANVRMGAQRFERGEKLTAGCRHARKKIFLFEDVQNSVARGRGHRMGLVSKSVL